MSLQVDDFDLKLLRILQRDARQGMQDLGDAVGLSASACHRRLRALERAGVIEGHRVALNAEALGFTMTFFVEVSLGSQTEPALEAFEKAVRDAPEILECNLMAGEADYLLRVVARDTQDFERLHRRLLSRLPGVARFRSNMSIRAVKSHAGLPL